MPESFRIEFPGSGHPALHLRGGATLSRELTAVNSPILFGCRSGICGTCLVEVDCRGPETLEPPDESETEALEVFAPGNPRARLACQLRLTADIGVRKLDSP